MKKTLQRLRGIRAKLRRKLRHRAEVHDKWVKTHQGGYAKEVKKTTRQVRYLKHLRDKLRKRRYRIKESHREGIDWSYGNISGEALKSAGKTFVCRYLSTDPAKNLSEAEAITYSRQGIDLVVVWESGFNNAALGFNQGQTDANHALAQAKASGKPTEAPIFFAVDFDAAGPEIESYFRGVASALGPERSGIYAGLDAVEYILDHKIVGWAWQTYAWSNHKWDKRAKLRQVLISLQGAELHISGIAVDYDKSVAKEFGQWRSTLA
jgi:hypothetical protein